MTMIEAATARTVVHSEMQQNRLVTRSSGTCESYDRTAVAGLSDWAIDAMSRPELVHLIRDCRLHALRPEMNRQLDSLDRRLLENLVSSLRRNCREQLAWSV